VRTALFVVVMAFCMGGLGYYAARFDIWYYHLGGDQAALTLWGAPLILTIAGGVWGYATATMDARKG
jgi:hypothetical protein